LYIVEEFSFCFTVNTVYVC